TSLKVFTFNGFGVASFLQFQRDMLRIHRSENGEVIFTLSGQLNQETIAELEKLINSEVIGLAITLNLKDVTLVNEDAVIFLDRCESNGITLVNCAPYIREWINRQRQGN